MKKRFLVLAVLGALLATARGQEVLPEAWNSYIELLSEDGEEGIVEDLLELYEDYKENPANLNDTAAGLREFFFVNDWQRACLKAYIAQYGPLLSLEELYAIEGFDSLTIALLRPLAAAEIVAQRQPLTLKEVLTQGHSNLVMGVSGTVEQARGYRDSIYEGDNLRLMWRYYYRYKDRMQLLIAGDKDPGEAFFSGSQQKGFDFYGYSLLLNDVGKRLRRLVIGQYHAQFGQGLTLWSGFGQQTPWGANSCRQSQGIRPNGAFTEYGYLQGAAMTLGLTDKTSLTLLYSYVDRDATLPRQSAADGIVSSVQSLYNSGYHRTQTEINKKHQLVEQLAGAHLEYRNTNLRLGFTAAAMMLEKPIVPAKYVYNDNVFRGDENVNAGVDFAYRHRKLLLFGEAAVCANNALDSNRLNVSPAALLGGEFALNNKHRLSATAHYYSPTYHNLHASALGRNGTPQNELGGSLYYQGAFNHGTTLALSADLFHFPHEKYLVYAPSSGKEFRAMLTQAMYGVKGLTLRVLYRYREKGRNITPSRMVDGVYLLEQTYRHQLQADVEFASDAWKLTSRFAYVRYSGDVTEADGGLLFYQDVQYHPQSLPLAIVLRYAWFDVDDYEARIYAAESDFVYQYSSIMYQNEGSRVYLLLRYDVSSHWNIGFKYGVTFYKDKDTFGSGYDLIEANHRRQWRLQVRFKW